MVLREAIEFIMTSVPKLFTTDPLSRMAVTNLGRIIFPLLATAL